MAKELKVDTISENSADTGVTIDGVKCKDNGVELTGDIGDGTKAATVSEMLSPKYLVGDVAALEGLENEVRSKDINPDNLLKNGSFKSWSAGPNVAPDKSSHFGGGSIARESTIKKIGSYSCKMISDADGNYLINSSVVKDGDLDYWKGRIITFSCYVYANDAEAAKIGIADGISTIYSNYHTGGGSWERLVVTKTIDANPNYIWCIFKNVGNTKTVYFDGAKVVEGSISFAFSPHVFDQALKTVNYQDSTPANYVYNNMRMECGVARLTFDGAENWKAMAVTFANSFTKICGAQASIITNGGLTAGQLRTSIQPQTLTLTGIETLTFYSGDGSSPDNGDYIDVSWLAYGVE